MSSTFINQTFFPNLHHKYFNFLHNNWNMFSTQVPSIEVWQHNLGLIKTYINYSIHRRLCLCKINSYNGSSWTSNGYILKPISLIVHSVSGSDQDIISYHVSSYFNFSVLLFVILCLLLLVSKYWLWPSLI